MFPNYIVCAAELEQPPNRSPQTRRIRAITSAPVRRKIIKDFIKRFAKETKRLQKKVGLHVAAVFVKTDPRSGDVEDADLVSSPYLTRFTQVLDLNGAAMAAFMLERRSEAADALIADARGSFKLEDLDLNSRRRLVKWLLKKAIRKLKQRFPFNASSAAEVCAKYTWYPADLPWRSPLAMTAEELSMLFTALVRALQDRALEIKTELRMTGLDLPRSAERLAASILHCSWRASQDVEQCLQGKRVNSKGCYYAASP